MALFDDTTTCRSGSLTKAVVGKSIETYLRTIAEHQGADPSAGLDVASTVDVSIAGNGSRVHRVELTWKASLELDSGEISAEQKAQALEDLISDLGGA